MSWKLALYDFIHNRNQMENDYDWNALRPHVEDDRYLETIRALQDRRRIQHYARGIKPVKAETRLRLRHLDTSAGTVIADTELRQRFDYRHEGRLCCEEKLVHEQITLKTVNGNWKITGVKYADTGTYSTGANRRDVHREAAENSAANASLKEDAVLEQPLWTAAGSRRAPFLNRELVGAFPGLEDPRQIPYRREQVRLYADTWWDSYNPAFLHFDVDCSNYVSQCIFAGGVPMNYTGRRDSGWWFRGRSGGQELWSYSWAVANALQVYLAGRRTAGLRAEQVASANQLRLGDVISYSWEGDGRYGHSTIVTGFDANGMPLVNAHTVNSRNRYWDYQDSYAWTERTKYRFFHIPDYL